MARVKNELRECQNIPRSLIFDNTISDRARFIYCFMAAKPEDWEFFLTPMAKELGYSVETLQKYINELVNGGWLVKGEQENENGRFGAREYIIKANKVLPNTENSVAENFRVGKSPLQQNIDNINKQEVKEKEKDNKLSSKKAKEFVPPTLDDVKAYIKEKGYHFDAKSFIDYYEADDWHYGKGSNRRKVSNWKRCCSTWEGTWISSRGGKGMYEQEKKDNRDEILLRRFYDILGSEEAAIYGIDPNVWYTMDEKAKNYHRAQPQKKEKLLKWIREHDNG